MKYFTLLLLSSLVFSTYALDIGASAPDFKLLDSKGKEHKLSEYKGKFVVLEWSHYGCPFVKKHYSSGNLPDLQKKYTSKGVIWLTICSTANSQNVKKIEESNTHYKNASTAYLLDSEGSVGRSFSAKTTPHVFIISKEGKLIYKGAIDSIASPNIADISIAKNYIAAALDAAQSGKTIEKASTKPYGCGIKYKR